MTDAVRRIRADTAGCRARRVVLMVVFIWIVSVFDLTFTMLAHKLGGFRELNPVARSLLDTSDALIIWKVATVFATSLVFLALRKRRVTETGCWGLAVVHTARASPRAGRSPSAG